MSAKHLSIDSEDPPKIESLLRLYSMLYCPFAHRARLILKAKDIPHEIVNINLFKKPEWYFKVHPEGKVPALIDGDNVVVESLDIANYLDEKYPQNPLYPAEPGAKEKDKELIQQIGSALKVFNECCFTEQQKSPEEWLKAFLETLQPFDDELSKRGTPFFGGDKPGMVDYMLWPWAERAPCIGFKLRQKLPIQDDQIPHLRKWGKTMHQDPVCAELHIRPEKFWKIVEAKLKGEDPPYDSLD